MTGDDRDLIAAFESLKSDRQLFPSVADLTSNDARRRNRRRRMVRMAALVAMIATPLLLAYASRREPSIDYQKFTALTGLDLGEVTWRAPSDFLLDIPGDDLLSTVPLIHTRIPVILPDSLRLPDSNTTPAHQRRSSDS